MRTRFMYVARLVSGYKLWLDDFGGKERAGNKWSRTYKEGSQVSAGRDGNCLEAEGELDDPENWVSRITK